MITRENYILKSAVVQIFVQSLENIEKIDESTPI